MGTIAARAAGVLRRVFAPLDVPITFRLWDGTTARVGQGDGGFTVVLHSRRIFWRVKLCAGWVTRRALADLELAPDAYPRTIQPFASVTIAVDGREHETRWDEPVSYGIVRAEFDTFLLRRAAGAGAEVREGVR